MNFRVADFFRGHNRNSDYRCNDHRGNDHRGNDRRQSRYHR